jgi:hypothetical protein
MSAAVASTGINAADPGNGVYESNEIADQAIAAIEIAESGVAIDLTAIRVPGTSAISEPARNSHIRQGVPKKANSSGLGKICSPIESKYEMTKEIIEITINIATDKRELMRILSLFRASKSTGKKI